MSTKVNRAHRSIKHDLIMKDNTRIVAAVAIAVFLLVFCGFAVKTLFSQSIYQRRVISAKEKTRDQLKANAEALEELKRSYEAFVNAPENALGGAPSGNGPTDGNNAKIILDALPDEYDFPALSTSFEKILVEGGYEIGTIGGSEDESVQSGATGEATPQEVAFTFSVKAPLEKTDQLLKTLERSIRPMHVDRLGISVGTEGILTTSVTLRTYYTQQKTFELGSEEVQ